MIGPNMLLTGGPGSGKTTLMRRYAQYLAARRDTEVWVFAALPGREWTEVASEIYLLTGDSASEEGFQHLEILVSLMLERRENSRRAHNVTVFFDWFQSLGLGNEAYLADLLRMGQKAKIQTVVAASIATVMCSPWLREYSHEVLVLGEAARKWRLWEK